ncbi:MAG: SdrD B-like domain-containing protein, partial [Planctomycetota bacterium]
DITNGGLNRALEIAIGKDNNPGGTFEITLFNPNGDSASTGPIATPLINVTTVPSTLFSFDAFGFPVVTGGGVDFTNIGAIQIEISNSASSDVVMAVLQAREPIVQTQNFSTTNPVSVGDTIFRDDNNNGTQDQGELGIQGVELDLYLDDGNGVLDITLDQLIAEPVPVVTDAAGNYLFDGLNPGDYFVHIPETQFGANEPLFGFSSSTGNNSEPAPGPNNDLNLDDNGTRIPGVGAASGLVTLVSGAEPTNDGDNDNNTNLSVDFGFFPEVDVEVTKTLIDSNGNPINVNDPLANDRARGSQAVFRINYTNNGPTDATGVTIVDSLPAGVSFVQTNNLPTGVTQALSNNNQTITYTVGNLAAGATAQLDIVVEIDQAATATQTNNVTISADQNETVVNNNSATADLDPITVTDLALTKTDNTDPNAAGNSLTYTLVATNNGPTDATGVVVTDTLPADVTFDSGNVAGNAAAVVHTNGVVTATIGNLASGATANITIVVNINPDAPNTITNNAVITNTPDTDPDDETDPTTNNNASEPTTINRDVDLSIAKTVVGNAPLAGGQVTYQIVVSNAG